MDLGEEKKEFLRITGVSCEKTDFQNSWKAALQRSNSYINEPNTRQKTEMRDCVRKKLVEFVQGECYASQKDLIEFIQYLSNQTSSQFKCILENQRFRIGMSQKVTNLYLKFFWCLDKINVPTHLPLDRVVQKHLPKGERISWTKLDCIENYQKTIDSLKLVAGNKTLSEWELDIWNKQKR
jgi:hypothetical protein